MGLLSQCIFCTACFQMFPPFSSIVCTPSALLPWYRSSSPCKLPWSEPQRRLLSVELRILSCFNMPSFFKALPVLHHAFFPAFSNVFPRIFPNGFLDFPFSLGFPGFPPAQWFLHNFAPVFSTSPLFFMILLHFPSSSLIFPTS